MGGSIFEYARQLEILVFFSGYPLIYYLVRFLTRNTSLKILQKRDFVSILPFAYALTGTIYAGLLIKDLYPDNNFENISHQIQLPYLTIWALLSVLFWIPDISRIHILSIIHSLVFFLIIVRDLFFQLTGYISDTSILKNDMKVYTSSVFLNLAAFIILCLLSFLPGFRKKLP
jgi:hypothetical protein